MAQNRDGGGDERRSRRYIRAVTASGFTTFDSTIGTCGIAWGPAGLIAVRLPESRRTVAESLRRRFPDLDAADPPTAVADAIDEMVGHLEGDIRDFRAVRLDMSSVGAFETCVYRLAQAIPAGETRTYGQLASELGDPNLSRAVGQALGRNPWPLIVPCHRITAADGRVGGFSAPGGAVTKMKLLEIEGALAAERLPLFSAVIS